MKKITLIASLFGIMAVFGFGFTTQSNQELSQIEQIHLTCWDEEGSSSFERIRFVLNTSLNGLIWFSKFDGQQTDEGTIGPEAKSASTAVAGQSFGLKILSNTQSFIAQIPIFVFQPHVRSVRVVVEKNDVKTSLECKKINLQKTQSASL